MHGTFIFLFLQYSALSGATDKDFFQFVQLKVQACKERYGRIGCVECQSVIQKENVKHDRASSSGWTGWAGSDEIPCTDLRQKYESCRLLLPVLSMLSFREEVVFTP